MIEEELIEHIEEYRNPRHVNHALRMLNGMIEDPLAWIVMDIDDFLIPRLEPAEGKIQALTSTYPWLRERAKYLLEDDWEMTLGMYKARNGLKWN